MSGEAIYMGYDRAALDAQYNNRARIPEYVDYFDRWLAWSAETRTALPGARDVPYGDLPVETLDIFPAEQPGAPILIMIHGGYWYSLDKHHDSFVAEGCRPHGVATVVINYGLAPDYRMDEIVRQNRAAAAWGLAQCRLLRRRSRPHPRARPVGRRPSRRHATGDRLARLRCRFACRPRQERGFDLGHLRPGAHPALLSQRQGRHGRGGSAAEQPCRTAATRWLRR